ncbi:MAG: DNA mismatch repair protein MutS, partial [Erythrobacter sp.]|nr:DNA mismatch repair protein MutS [Erythrobacter sp.]
MSAPRAQGRAAPRGLSPEEQAAWSHLAQSVTPLAGRTRPAVQSKTPEAPKPQPVGTARPKRVKPKGPLHVTNTVSSPPPRMAENAAGTVPVGLDSHWERRFKSGRVEPDLTLDLHGHTLDTAYTRITAGLDQARAMGARVVLVIAGR